MVQEGEEPKVSAILYRAVEQAVLSFGAKTWVLLASMERKVEVTNTCFLQHITGKQLKRLVDMTWEMPRVEGMWEAEVKKSDITYIGR